MKELIKKILRFFSSRSRSLIGSAIQFFGIGLAVHDFLLECQKVSDPFSIHGFWIGILLIIAGWIILNSKELFGDQT